MARFRVAGRGHALPDDVVGNDELARRVSRSADWISEVTGMRDRHVCGPADSTGSLATAAATAALADAGLQVADVDLLVVATQTPEQLVPSTAAGVCHDLDSTAACFDINAGCASYICALVIGAGSLALGTARVAVVVGADTVTRFVNPHDAHTSILFGDGAGAVVLVRSDAGGVGGLLSSDWANDPEGVGTLVIPGGGSRRPASAETVARGEHVLAMDGAEVFRRAVLATADSVARTLDRAGCTIADVDLVVPHQANSRIIEALVRRAGLSAERVVDTVSRHGNTAAASIPLALADAPETRSIPDGALVLLCGFGAGMTVGSALIRWQTT